MPKMSKSEFAAAVKANRATFIAAKAARNEFFRAYEGGADNVYAWPLERLQAIRAALVAGCEAYYDVCGVMWDAMFTIREVDGVIEDLTM